MKMKISHKRLREIIREEVTKLDQEGFASENEFKNAMNVSIDQVSDLEGSSPVSSFYKTFVDWNSAVEAVKLEIQETIVRGNEYAESLPEDSKEEKRVLEIVGTLERRIRIQENVSAILGDFFKSDLIQNIVKQDQ
jgi:hypothetical protein